MICRIAAAGGAEALGVSQLARYIASKLACCLAAMALPHYEAEAKAQMMAGKKPDPSQNSGQGQNRS